MLDIAGKEFFYEQEKPMNRDKHNYLLYRAVDSGMFLVENVVPGIYSAPIPARIKVHQPAYKFIGQFDDWYVCKKVQEEILAKEFSKSK